MVVMPGGISEAQPQSSKPQTPNRPEMRIPASRIDCRTASRASPFTQNTASLSPGFSPANPASRFAHSAAPSPASNTYRSPPNSSRAASQYARRRAARGLAAPLPSVKQATFRKPFSKRCFMQARVAR